MKVISVVGARPQFVKAGVVSRELRKNNIREIFLHTGQHYDFEMSEIFFRELGLPEPDYYLGIGSGSHGEQTGKMLIEIEKVLFKEEPDLIIVYGDTNSTMAGALAAVKLHIPVAHVEAGLRSFNRKMPEEINRIVADHISELLFAPTDVAIKNLNREGITKGVYKVGDVMYDVALEVSKNVKVDKILEKFGLREKDFVLVTIHRAENTDIRESLVNIWKALLELAGRGIVLLFPVHPRTRKKLEEYGLIDNKLPENLKLVKPVSYFEMVALEKTAKVIITDSGGVQKEGYFMGTPCVIPRNETEWVELVEIGWNRLAGVERERIVKEILFLWNNNPELITNDRLLGQGDASHKITALIIDFLNENRKIK